MSDSNSDLNRPDNRKLTNVLSRFYLVSQILIGYSSGFITVWDLRAKHAEFRITHPEVSFVTFFTDYSYLRWPFCPEPFDSRARPGQIVRRNSSIHFESFGVSKDASYCSECFPLEWAFSTLSHQVAIQLCRTSIFKPFRISLPNGKRCRLSAVCWLKTVEPTDLVAALFSKAAFGRWAWQILSMSTINYRGARQGWRAT